MKDPKELIDAANLEKLKKYLSTSPRIVILAHAGPDGDAIGSTLGLCEGLKSLGIEASVACLDGVPDFLSFCPFAETMQKDFDENKFDAVWFTDCGAKKMTRFHETKPDILSDKMVKINLDHHPTNDLWGEINFVATHAASSSQIVFRLLQALGAKITPRIATCLLLGIYTDTGSFMHQNTTPEVYQASAELMKLGANAAQISKHVFRSHEFRVLKLWGRVLQNLYVTDDGAAIVGVNKKDYESIGATREDLAGVIDYINSMPEAKYSVLLSEDEKGNVKASLRTRKPDVDVKALAEKFGGGGHIKASGFTIKDSHLKKEVKWKIVENEG
ncbi:bifunctional oligoribonuclease/PAP phosphatase NrnA [Candidatus Gracilibacteria bacterium]|nr:bifunctional oligoribonuclease/PAP phosphatase NrnA [Candidatus Gracilibacteria bacterium]